MARVAWQSVEFVLLAVMRKADLAAVLPNVIYIDAAISACDSGRQWQQALGVLAVRQQTAVLPNVSSYNAAIHLFMWAVSCLHLRAVFLLALGCI